MIQIWWVENTCTPGKEEESGKDSLKNRLFGKEFGKSPDIDYICTSKKM